MADDDKDWPPAIVVIVGLVCMTAFSCFWLWLDRAYPPPAKAVTTEVSK